MKTLTSFLSALLALAPVVARSVEDEPALCAAVKRHRAASKWWRPVSAL